jgi:hypothetical protein
VEACGAELRAMRVPREEFDQGVRERLGALARADFGDKEFALRWAVVAGAERLRRTTPTWGPKAAKPPNGAA